MRIKLGLRGLLLMVLLVAILMGFETRRAYNQRLLESRLIELNGSFQRIPRRNIPEFARALLPHEYRDTISEVTFGGVAAPFGNSSSSKLVSTRTLRKVAELPAMRRVQIATLVGTSVDDSLAELVRMLPSMEQVLVDASAVTDENFYLKQMGRMRHRLGTRNGDEYVRWLHQPSLRVTADLQLFARAAEEEPSAILDLLDAVPAVGPATAGPPILDAISEISSPPAVDILRHGMNDPRTSIRLVCVQFFLTRKNSLELANATEDSDLEVRQQAIQGLLSLGPASMKDQSVIDAICKCIADENAPIRWAVVNWLPSAKPNGCFEMLRTSIKDEASNVRSAAARSLGALGDRRGIPLLQNALGDPDRYVRSSSKRSLEALSSVDDLQNLDIATEQ